MYTIASHFFLHTHSLVPSFFVHDKYSQHKKGQDILQEYLSEAEGIFKKELQILSNTKCEFTQADEERLIRMLTLIIEARKAWQEEEKTTIC